MSIVSIILPTYNGEKYICDSINSVINQTYTDWELIVIDDCSTDSTYQLVQEYAQRDNRIKLFRNEKNLKLPATLNVGFSKATGKFLTWTSDDNLYMENAIERMVALLQSNKQLALVFSRMENIDFKGDSLGLTDIPESEQEIFYHNIVGASFMYTRTIYEEIGGYDTNKFLMEDYDYWLRISRKAEIKYIPDVLYKYRQHLGSLTESRNRQVLEGKVKILEEQLNVMELKENIMRMVYKELAEALFSLDRYDEMKSYLNKMKEISGNMKGVRIAVRISYYIGSKLSTVMKRILKKKRKE